MGRRIEQAAIPKHDYTKHLLPTFRKERRGKGVGEGKLVIRVRGGENVDVDVDVGGCGCGGEIVIFVIFTPKREAN